MKKSEQQLKEEMKKMMRDSFHQNELYTAGNYWKFYEKNICTTFIVIYVWDLC